MDESKYRIRTQALRERQTVALEGIQQALWILIGIMEANPPYPMQTDPDADPDPFQTLNGPSIKAKVPVGYLK